MMLGEDSHRLADCGNVSALGEKTDSRGAGNSTGRQAEALTGTLVTTSPVQRLRNARSAHGERVARFVLTPGRQMGPHSRG